MLRKAIPCLIAAALGLLWPGAVLPARAQGLPDFPQTVSPSTVLGRMPGTSGPVQAIPFASLLAQLNNLSTVVYGPGTTVSGDLVTWCSIVGTAACDSGIAVTGTGTIAMGSANTLTLTGSITLTGGGTLNVASGKTATDTSAIGASVLLGATGGGFAAFAGSTCAANQGAISISTAGVLTCAARAATNKTVASPTGPNSTSVFKMQGLAGTVTPTFSGNIQITISGTVTTGSNTVGQGLQWQISHGTGTAPTSNAALTGSQDGVVQTYTNPTTVTGASVSQPFSVSVVVTGLTLNTAYWIDLAAESIGANNSQLTNVDIAVVEL